MSTGPKVYRQCLKKRRYGTAQQAWASAFNAVEARGTPLRWYYCNACLGFHLTSRPKGQGVVDDAEVIAARAEEAKALASVEEAKAARLERAAERTRLHNEAVRDQKQIRQLQQAWFKDRMREAAGLIRSGQPEEAFLLLDACASLPRAHKPRNGCEQTARLLAESMGRRRAYLAARVPSSSEGGRET